jgi:hypothetical protein
MKNCAFQGRCRIGSVKSTISSRCWGEGPVISLERTFLHGVKSADCSRWKDSILTTRKLLPVMNIIILNVTQRSPVYIHRRFGGNIRPLSPGSKSKPRKNQQEAEISLKVHHTLSRETYWRKILVCVERNTRYNGWYFQYSNFLIMT